MTTPRDDGGLLSPDARPRPWNAQIDIDAGHARRLIHSRFPDIAAVTITPFGRGWDNSAFLVDDAIVFRFPRKASAAPLLETEARALPVIGPRVPLNVPVPELR